MDFAKLVLEEAFLTIERLIKDRESQGLPVERNLKRQSELTEALNNLTSSSRIIKRSELEGLEAKMKRLMDAITKMHPLLAMDDPKQEELYLSLHSLKESVTYL
jgi:hypothetical protein